MYDYIIKSVLIFLKTNEKNGLENDLEIRHTDTAVRPGNKTKTDISRTSVCFTPTSVFVSNCVC